MVAVLASPRFVFRVEETEAEVSGPIPAQSLLDEYALASRLSYFLWSTMPDDELFRLAERHELRENLAAQVTRICQESSTGPRPGAHRNFVVTASGARC